MISKFKIQNSKFISNRGVTLVELIIVLAILTLVVGSSVNIFISILQRQKRLFAEDELFVRVNYALDYMSGLMQGATKDTSGTCLGESYAGYNYLLTNFDSQSGFYQGITFITKEAICQQFFVDEEGLLKEIKDSSEEKNVLSDIFKVKHAKFVINGDKTLQGSLQSDSIQPRVTLLLNVQYRSLSNVEKTVQTTVSQRNLNIP